MTAALARLGAALGGVDFVQGAGGNASEKVGDTLHVKASGVRMRGMEHPGAVATAPLALVQRALDGDADAEGALLRLTPRPSLEVLMHGLGPRVVAHTHPVGVLLVACARDAAAPSLGAVPVRTVPYARPGAELAAAVRMALEGVRGAAVLLLRAHGMIAFADDVAEAIGLTIAFDRACRDGFDAVPSLDAVATEAPRAIAGGYCLTLPEGPHPRGGALFPDAAVFCPRLDVTRADEAAATEALRIAPRPVVLGDGARRVIAAPTEEGAVFAREVLAAHDAVTAALGARASRLDPQEMAAIARMPAELYRLGLSG
jgi:ribulose-5-phosphate 4-epimerase/fuculose-1-phosphate aldolase